MKLSELIFKNGAWSTYGNALDFDPNLILFFAAKTAISDNGLYEKLREQFPTAIILGCSTAGEIIKDEVLDDSAVAMAVRLERTGMHVACAEITESKHSQQIGKELASKLPHEDLKSVIVLSDGQHVNGTALISGLRSGLPEGTIVTGGLAGDGTGFQTTLVSCNSPMKENRLAVLGLYGDHVRVSHGSVGGWDTFGPERKITRSAANILYELDGRPALELYKKYLGEEAENLPSSALLFPLSIFSKENGGGAKVRTILNIDEDSNSMTFAGDMPTGYHAQLMMANFERLVEGASSAAKHALTDVLSTNNQPKLAILISCIGRKLVLGSKIVDEVEATKAVFDQHTRQIGFYSYGELSPHVETGNCELHNQTMTITLIAE